MRQKGSKKKKKKGTLGQVKYFFNRTSTHLWLPSSAVPGCCLVCLWRSFRTKSFYTDLLGVHTEMGLRAPLSQPSQRKEKPAQWVSLSWAAGQSGASRHICLSKRLAHCFRTDFNLQGREELLLDKGGRSRALQSSGTTGAHRDLSVGHWVLAVVIKLSPILKDRPLDPTERY